MSTQQNPLIRQSNNIQISSESRSARSATAGARLAPKTATEPPKGPSRAATTSANSSFPKQSHGSTSSSHINKANNDNARTMTQAPRRTDHPFASQRMAPQRSAPQLAPSASQMQPQPSHMQNASSFNSRPHGFSPNPPESRQNKPPETHLFHDPMSADSQGRPSPPMRVLGPSIRQRDKNHILNYLGKKPNRVEETKPNQVAEIKLDRVVDVKEVEALAREVVEIKRKVEENKKEALKRKKSGLPTPPPSPPTDPHGDTQSESKNIPSTSNFTFDHEVLESTKVRFGPGLSIEMVTTPSDPTRIIIWGVPPNTSSQDMGWYLRTLGTVMHWEFDARNPESGERAIQVRFAHHEEALNAIKQLDGQPGLGTTMPLVASFDTSLAPNLTSTNIITDTVILRWKVPVPKLRLYYKEPKVARQEAEVINRRLFDGRPLRATLRASRHVIFVEGLTKNADLQEIIRRHAPDNEPYFMDQYNHSQVLQQMTQLVEEDSDLRQHTVRESPEGVTIIAKFRTSEGAESFLRRIGEMEFPWRASAKLSIIHGRDLLYIMTRDKYESLQAQIDELRFKLFQANIRLHVLIPEDHKHYRHIRVTGSRHVKDYKPMIDAILNGEVVMRNGAPLWDSDLELLYGSLVFSDIPIAGVQIWADARRKRITVFGPDERRASAIRRIGQRVTILKRALYSRNFPRWQFPYWDTTGLRILEKEFTKDNIFVDSRSCRILVRGERAGRWLHTIAEQAPQRPPRPPIAEGGIQCPVCLGTPVDAVTMLCKHQYCKACLSRYLVSATQPGASFPFRCFGSNSNCNNLIPIHIFRNLLSHDQIEIAMSRSFEYYVNLRPEEYRQCPTSDCTQIHRVHKKSDSPEAAQHCHSCLIKFCASCFAEGGHDGRTCAQYIEYREQIVIEQDKEVEGWIKSLGGRTCPKCNMGLIKDGGCAHVQCSRCKIHICWTCGKAFEDVAEESVYEHMRREHGGIGLFDFAGGEWADDANDDLRYLMVEPVPPRIVEPPPPAQRQPIASTSGSSNGRPSGTKKGGLGKGKRAPRLNRRPRRLPIYHDYDDETSEDEDDDFGGGEWDYDYADMNWEAL